MGQYSKIVNIDKKEYLHPHKMGSGLKFYEILSTQMPQALAYLLRQSTDDSSAGETKGLVGHWAGDRITIVGDYDESNLYHLTESYKDISLELESIESEKEIWQFEERWDK
jgi:hypothetical protein